MVSDWMSVGAGVPQGTKLGPILFLVMLNDLIPLNNDYWKYVEEMSMSQIISRNGVSNMQSDLDHISSWATDNYMKLNPTKCKELRISFLRQQPNFSQIHIDSAPIPIVESAKVLGVSLQNNLKWKSHVDNITKKAAKRLYILCVLKRNGLHDDNLKTIFMTLIRSVLQYGCPVWHSSLPAYLSNKIENIQRRAFRNIYPFKSYSDGLSMSGCLSLAENRQQLSQKLFKQIKSASSDRLSYLIPETEFYKHGCQLQNSENLDVFKCNTNRFKNSFFPTNLLFQLI